jgi:hypothetical protein
MILLHYGDMNISQCGEQKREKINLTATAICRFLIDNEY